MNGGVPVELASFTAEEYGGSVMLSWVTATETNNRGFEVERARHPEQTTRHPELVSGSPGSPWQTIGFVQGNGTTTEPHSYSFTDDLSGMLSGSGNAQPGAGPTSGTGTYFYRLKQIDFDGGFQYSKTVAVSISSPAKYSLEQNYPNPFNPATKIKYSLPQTSRVQIKVFDVLGNEVAVLVNEEKPAGIYELSWNAASLPSGVYFYQIKAGSYAAAKKAILLK